MIANGKGTLLSLSRRIEDIFHAATIGTVQLGQDGGDGDSVVTQHTTTLRRAAKIHSASKFVVLRFYNALTLLLATLSKKLKKHQ